MASPVTPSGLTFVPANEATWDDLQAVLGTKGDPARCQCQRYKLTWHEYHDMTREERSFRLLEETDCGHPDGGCTTGIVAYLDGVPVGWCNIEPRPNFTRMQNMPIPWSGRQEDRSDPSVWVVACFVIRLGHRRKGISRALAMAAIDFARSRGARALEAYPMATQEGVEITWGELHVGSRNSFAAAGFKELTHPTKRRYVMRIDFDQPPRKSRAPQ
jgi:GNAT superfamily N-acetyltransferase